MKKCFLLIFVFFIFGSLTNVAKSQSTPEELMSPFFKMFDTDVNKSIDYLFSTNPLIDSNQQGVNALKEKFESSRKLLGNYYGYELVAKYYLGQSYAKYIYSLKYERQPIEFVVYMYCPDKKWKLQNVNFHAELEDDMILVK